MHTVEYVLETPVEGQSLPLHLRGGQQVSLGAMI